MESHGRDRDDGFRNPPGTEVHPHRSEAEARRTPSRVQSLMLSVGSDEQMASMGFAFDDRCRSMDAYWTAGKNVDANVGLHHTESARG